MARIDKHVAAALTQVLPTRTDTRYNLRGIKLDADGTTVATDGHILLTAPPRPPPQATTPSGHQAYSAT